MADGEVLKRLGGGRWKTADDRFTVEPQSGSWVLVDAEQTDDLGLPLVRGPFASLTAARAAIDAARMSEAPVSPLAARVEQERRHPRPRRPTGPVTRLRSRRPEPPPPPPPEPAWIGGLPNRRRVVARQLIERLTDAGITGITSAEDVARAEVVDGEPAIARVALEEQLRRALARSTDRRELAGDIIGLLVSGEDQELQVRWRLVDGDDRPLAPLMVDTGPGS